MRSKAYVRIVVVCLVCIAVAGAALWAVLRQDKLSVEEAKANVVLPETLVDIGEQQVPQGSYTATVSPGDTIVVNITAERMDDVYGYQFELLYDMAFVEYNHRLFSDIEDIETIFAADKERHLLVGATMLGDVNGYSGKEISVCRIEFVALTGFACDSGFASEHISISNVNIVTGGLQYLENMEGWTVNVSAK